MPRSRAARRAEDLRATQVLVACIDPIMLVVEAAVHDVEPGHAELPRCAQDTRLILDIARRLDDAVPLPEPIEGWDVLAWVLVAGLALGIYRRTSKRAPLDPTANARRVARLALKSAQKRATAS